MVIIVQLRDYQYEAIEAKWSYWHTRTGNPLTVMPTGTGKSYCIGGFLKRALYTYTSTRSLMITHVKELIEENARKMLEYWPEAPLGIYSAGLNRKDFIHPIIYGGIDSMINNPELFGYRDFALIDEGHLVSPNAETRYRDFFKFMLKINPNFKVGGYTATDFRLGQGRLTEGEGALFTDVAIDLTSIDAWNRFVAEGYLVPPIPKRTSTIFNLSNVSIQNGDYKLTELSAAVDKTDINHSAVREMIQEGWDRRCWLSFCSGIEHAEHIAELLRGHGIPTVAIHNRMKAADRDEAIKDYKAGKLRALTNNNILTTGFDHPPIDYIAMKRPTVSTGLWVQMLGRGTRPAPGKTNCLVSDFAGNTVRLGPINDPVIPRPRGRGNGEAPVKICEACGTYNHASARTCINCGAAFNIQVKITAIPSPHELFRGDLPIIEVYDVIRTFHHQHFRRGDGAPSIRIDYFCVGPGGNKTFSEWINFESKGFALHVAHQFWHQRVGENPPPTNALALDYLSRYDIMQPRQIRVHTNLKYPRVLSHVF